MWKSGQQSAILYIVWTEKHRDPQQSHAHMSQLYPVGTTSMDESIVHACSNVTVSAETAKWGAIWEWNYTFVSHMHLKTRLTEVIQGISGQLSTLIHNEVFQILISAQYNNHSHCKKKVNPYWE